MPGKKQVMTLAMSMLMGALDAAAQTPVPQDSTHVVMEDTLREVVIGGRKAVDLPMSNGLKSSIKGIVDAQKYSLTGLIGETAADYILHPFGFAERKRAKKRKKVKKVLREYDAMQDPLKEVLDSVANVIELQDKK